MSTREKALWVVAGVLIIIYALFPIAWIISLSLKSSADISNGQFLPTDFSWTNYSQLFTGSASDLFLPALRNSFGICLIATAISSVLAMFAAYAIARI
ncbi:MAG: Maltodextrin ABC transporter, permease protein MdxG, partial [uncultured Actinomycetospora sp.]